MLELARGVEVEWGRQGRDAGAVARSRIAVARAVLETSDATWERVRDEVLALLLPPPEPGSEPAPGPTPP
jgi:hypothetical protein